MTARLTLLGTRTLCCLLVAGCLGSQSRSQITDERPKTGAASIRDLGGYLPAETLLTAELRDAEAWLGELLALPDQLSGKAQAAARAGIAMGSIGLRGLTGSGPRDSVRDLAPGQVVFALVRIRQQVEPLLLSRLAPGVEIASFGRLHKRIPCAEVEGVLVIARTRSVLKDYLKWHRMKRPTLAEKKGYFSGRPELYPGAQLRLYLDLETLRERGSLDVDLEAAQAYFAAGWLDAMRCASRLDATLVWNAGSLRLAGQLNAPLDESISYLASGVEPYSMPPDPEGMLGRLVFDRSLSDFWSSFSPSKSEQTAIDAFLSIADLLLGTSFVDELLPALGEPLVVFAIREAVDGDVQSPIDIPGIALVAPIRDPKLVPILRSFVQRIAMIVSNERREKGLVPFGLRRGKTNRGESLWIAEPEEWRGPEPTPLACTLSPTFAIGTEHVVIATTENSARAMLDALASKPVMKSRGDGLQISMPGLLDYMKRNRPTLILNKVLDEGVTVAKAEEEQVFLSAVIGLFERLQVSIMHDDKKTDFEVRLGAGR